MRRGFTLLEVVVALVLLEVGVLGAVGTLAVASRTLAQAQRLERTVLEAEGVLDSLAGAADAASGARAFAGGALEWTVDGAGWVELVGSGPDGTPLIEIRWPLSWP
jgi:prepilin-type N-terminal cleavage/methylation domain-containing protein